MSALYFFASIVEHGLSTIFLKKKKKNLSIYVKEENYSSLLHVSDQCALLFRNKL